MRVLFFIQSLSAGGAERVTAILANHWAQSGWAVTVVTVAGEDRDFYGLDPRIKRISLGLAIQSRHPGQAVWNNLRRIWSLHRILRREKPDVAVAMMTTANVTLALAGRLARVPVVGSERTHPPAMPLGHIWEWMRRQTYPLLDGLVAQTETSAVWLQEHAAAKRIEVIQNPVNYPLTGRAPRTLPAEVLGSFPGKRVLLAVGRLVEEKGFDQLLASFANVSEKHPDWVLVILGKGEQRDVLMQQAAELGVSGRVVMPGTVGNMGEWFEAADLYVLTSRFEGFPNTLLEALAHGVPAVVVDCETGPREIIRHEVDGLLVPQNDPEALAAALVRMMADAGLRARFAGRAVEARERFAVERIAGKWEALFRSV